MKDNKLIIRINKPASTVFQFYINPQNTPLWLDSIIQEVTSERPVGVGTKYKNKNRNGIWSEYTVTAFKENELFELVSEDKNYHVRYTHKILDTNLSELTYYEWVDQGNLEEPFTLEILEKLKKVIEC